jgi:hypothetical protein
MMKTKIPSREMQELRSQSHQEKKMNKILIAMLTFSEDPSIMKEATRKEMMINRNLTLFTKTTRMSLEELFHQEGISQPDVKISSLDIICLAIILVIKKHIVEFIQEVTM